MRVQSLYFLVIINTFKYFNLMLVCIQLLGEKYDVFITTPLSVDGTFNVQLSSAEGPAFTQMTEQLQQHCKEQMPSATVFGIGDVCAAQFSEDECWYRARVEQRDGEQVSGWVWYCK